MNAAGTVVGEVGRSADLADDIQDHLHERCDHGGERGRHHEGDGELDQVAPQYEIPEALHRSTLTERAVRPGAPRRIASLTQQSH